MKRIISGREVKISKEDLYLLDQKGWTFDGRYITNMKNKKKVYLHRLIQNAQPGQLIDHIDRNRLNNLRSNLRFATVRENTLNSRTRSDNKSGHRGVSYMKFGKRVKRWRAYMNLKGKQVHLGYFISRRDAARAYQFSSTSLGKAPSDAF